MKGVSVLWKAVTRTQSAVMEPSISRLRERKGFLIDAQEAAEAVGLDLTLARDSTLRPPLLNARARLRLSPADNVVMNTWSADPFIWNGVWTAAEANKNWCTQQDVQHKVQLTSMEHSNVLLNEVIREQQQRNPGSKLFCVPAWVSSPQTEIHHVMSPPNKWYPAKIAHSDDHEEYQKRLERNHLGPVIASNKYDPLCISTNQALATVQQRMMQITADGDWRFEGFVMAVSEVDPWDKTRPRMEHTQTLLGCKMIDPNSHLPTRPKLCLFLIDPHDDSVESQEEGNGMHAIHIAQKLDVEVIYKLYGGQGQLDNCYMHTCATIRKLLVQGMMPNFHDKMQVLPVPRGKPSDVPVKMLAPDWYSQE